jgi:hypothetical protein
MSGPRCCARVEQPSADIGGSQLGALPPERCAERDRGRHVAQVEDDLRPLSPEIAVAVGLAELDAVTGRRCGRTAVVPCRRSHRRESTSSLRCGTGCGTEVARGHAPVVMTRANAVAERPPPTRPGSARPRPSCPRALVMAADGLGGSLPANLATDHPGPSRPGVREVGNGCPGTGSFTYHQSREQRARSHQSGNARRRVEAVGRAPSVGAPGPRGGSCEAPRHAAPSLVPRAIATP